jgi:indolepyruvate decarboxylase
MQRAERVACGGYARLNGLGALLVTNGVGALSAINGVGGSYSEHVPVICIAGSIPLRSIDRGLGMHHTMADGSWDHFLDAYAHVTAAHARLTPCNAATEIDRLILTAWREKLPVYMELPSDIAYLEIEVPTSPLVLAHAPSDAERLRSCIAAIAERLAAATSPAILVDADADRFGVAPDLKALAEKIQAPIAVIIAAKSGDRRDIRSLRWHLQRQGKRTACTRGNRDQRLLARHRLPAHRGDHGPLLGFAARRHDSCPRLLSRCRR